MAASRLPSPENLNSQFQFPLRKKSSALKLKVDQMSLHSTSATQTKSHKNSAFLATLAPHILLRAITMGTAKTHKLPVGNIFKGALVCRVDGLMFIALGKGEG